MSNTNKLKGFIAECGKNQKYFSNKCNISTKSFSLKLNEENQFKEQEINIILAELNRLLPYVVKYEDVFLDRKYTQTEMEGY